ncbi:DUF488 family protein [Klebsiella pneumoniae]|uniref:DUF488 family protein n=1 Tax=Enterobacteriaceae TaxID=543 RepID=UPI001E4D635E|nr:MULTISPECIES: DUF488 family protein [Enterobacteriaceae]MDX8988777.1 DUF488 family protein [Salmonella enterica]MEA1549592.1 DUF488 family protein [Salmonella enterica subsp. enterica serovar Minnesota]MDI2632799.1 DUF488 family protein [Klebsiella pneumoniae]MDX9002576.1 DUF488 family protein [Salmonella enterica]MDX9093974.1 DUF488 family protein [Salmonella enterica]
MRLNNRSQLAGFAKHDDLKFFAHTLCDIDYAHMPDLAPTREMFERYKLQKGVILTLHLRTAFVS